MSELVPLTSLTRPRAAAERTADAGQLLRGLRKKVGQALTDWPEMIEDGDRLMACISGGKDSYALLDVLLDLQRRAPVRFEVVAVNIDQGWPGYRTDLIAAHLASLGVEHHMITEDYAEIVEAKLRPGQTPCSLCSRFRRGVLYNLAVRLGCTKIALGHHADDLIETLVLNLFYSGKLASMPAVLRSDDGRNTVIRPLVYVAEDSLAAYAEAVSFPVVSCGCPSCGLPGQKRQVVKQLLGSLEAADPGLKQQMLAALRNVNPSHLLDPTVSRTGPGEATLDSRSRTT